MTIIALSEAACGYLKSIENMEKNKSNAADLEATYKALQEAKETAMTVRDLFQLMQKRLPIGTMQQIELPKVLKELQQLQESFTEQRRQVQELRSITSQLSRLQSKINLEWRKYAEARIQPYLDLHNTVRSLPAIRDQETSLNRLNTTLLRYATSTVPQKQYELTYFDNCFNEYRQKLSSLENLHPDIRTFLQKANDHTATMADVTDEVLQWCRQSEHAKAFRISFTM